MYELYIGNKNYSSWSLRPWLLMRSLDIPFTERLMPFSSAFNWQAFRSFAPNGMVPCLKQGATTVWDSLAIVEYLAERHPGVWPTDTTARAWARCAAAEMHSGFSTLRAECTTNLGVRVRLHQFSEPLRRDMERINELWCEGLARFGGSFLAGEAFTAVDAFFAPVAFRVQTYALQLDPAATGYGGRLLRLPAMLEWYQAALREPWREPGHESELREHGAIIEDLRQ